MVTKEYLQTTIEELESANEELKSSNEELQSSNEELQSTNEELETSKEELQSANEELTTVNDELQTRMADHQQTLDDLYNVMTNVDDAVVVVGMDLRARRFNPAAERAFNLVQTDLGRSISHLNAFFLGARIEQLCAQVIESLTPVDREFEGADQRRYSLRITPYRTLEHSITGAVLVFSALELKRSALQPDQEVMVFADGLLDALGRELLLARTDGRIVWVSSRLRELGAGARTDAAALAVLGVSDEAQRELASRLATMKSPGAELPPFELPRELPGGGAGKLRVSARRLPPIGAETKLVLLSVEITPEPEDASHAHDRPRAIG